MFSFLGPSQEGKNWNKKNNTQTYIITGEVWPCGPEGDNGRVLLQVLQTVRLAELLDKELELRIPLKNKWNG
jgi:hypothetical protein